ncbi:glycosyl transferase family 1 [Dokdonia sp. Dokd-P16]|uniref:glycosyl transferase family 1 n=1 Tax=Dokdonia sp. Dokd-P16 TaxID=2173169 RepID=UPI000D548CE4|nr:glycosyl transferase family 1 [Dokdonia sp. Dokd-P16]AWH75384.1 glycosyl transferase family 1 [Dokdonia sp. Dokd-P16]
MNNKVLIIAYYWPPAGGPGVQRWLKFAKYLPEFGVEPIVYVPENPSYPILDDSLVAEVSDKVTVIKQPIREPYGWASTLSRKQTKTISSGILPKEGKQSLLQKAMLYVRGNFFVPDARVGWVAPSVEYLKMYIEENNIEKIITTGPPHSLHLIGNQLKNWKPSLNWLADFRDPWTTIGYHDKLRMTAKTNARHKLLEKQVLTTANHIIVTSPGTKREFQSITKRPITVITNGFDDRIITPHHPSERFVLSHIGSLLSDRNPQLLWKVLRELCDELPAFSKALEIQLVGKVSQEIIDAITECGLESQLNLVGYVSHQEAQRLQGQANALLLIEINAEKTKGIIAGKLFEYLSAQRPIVAIGPQGADIGTIIEKTATGSFVDYSQEKKLKTVIKALFTGGYKYASNENEVANYHRRELTAQLSNLIAHL